MSASDSFIGEALAPSPYSELSTKYEALSARFTCLLIEMAGIEPGVPLGQSRRMELAKYRALRAKYCGGPTATWSTGVQYGD